MMIIPSYLLDFIISQIEKIDSPSHGLLLAMLLKADFVKKERENEVNQLIYRIRATAVLSLAIK